MAAADKTFASVPTPQYLAAIAHHVSSVCVIATEIDGARYGLTATAVASVSAEPPRLLACVNKSGLTHQKIVAAEAFDCVIAEMSEQSSHTVLFGDVVATQHRAGRDTPLYGARRFRQLRKVYSGMQGGQEEFL